tara:strand:- start:3708 stop:3947 length:240 start_codon:yes stop_codon:yes gene_type:complete
MSFFDDFRKGYADKSSLVDAALASEVVVNTHNDGIAHRLGRITYDALNYENSTKANPRIILQPKLVDEQQEFLDKIYSK